MIYQLTYRKCESSLIQLVTKPPDHKFCFVALQTFFFEFDFETQFIIIPVGSNPKQMDVLPHDLVKSPSREIHV